MVDAYQEAALATRLGIPMLYGIDAVHGHDNVVGATIFPHNVGLGAAERPGARRADRPGDRGRDGRDRHPLGLRARAGRARRTCAGAGPTRASARTRCSWPSSGARSSAGSRAPTSPRPIPRPRPPSTSSATAAPPGARRRRRATRIDQGVTDLDEATLRAIHLTPYEDAIEAGVRIVMASFSSTGAGKVHGDHHLLTEVLKGELGFTGFVVSDWAGVDQVDPDYDTAVATAISAGIDMVMVPYDAARVPGRRPGRPRRRAPSRASGSTTPSRRILRVKFELGLFETPMPPSGHGRRPRFGREPGPGPEGRGRVRGPAQDEARACCRSPARATSCSPGRARTTSASSRAAGRSSGRARPGRSRPARRSPTPWRPGSAIA